MKKQGELVRLTTQDLNKAIPITTSLLISEQFDKRHDSVLRDIRKLKEQLEKSLSKEDFNLYKIVEIKYVDPKGRSYPMYELNEDIFMMLVMGYNTQKAFKIKNEFIKQFKFMKHELIARVNTRHIGKEIGRRELTQSIDENTIEGNFKNFSYSNYTRLIYKKILGTQVKKFKEKNNIPEKDNVRDYFSISTLRRIQILESKIAGIIEFSKEEDPKKLYKEITEFVKMYNGEYKS